jgi:hypothetical protein
MSFLMTTFLPQNAYIPTLCHPIGQPFLILLPDPSLMKTSPALIFIILLGKIIMILLGLIIMILK